MAEGGAVREAVYRRLLALLADWEKARHRRDFARVESFCLFVGYPRSGHSIVGALLNAHRHVVVAHELNVVPLIAAGWQRDDVFARILARARWFHLRANRANYDYAVPTGWQGRFEELRVIGDKRGGLVARWLLEHPEFLTQVRSVVRVPLRLVHIVRNPYDNIAAISKWDRRSLRDSTDYYFRHCEATRRLPQLCSPAELIELRHERVVADPRATLAELCRFLGVEADRDYLDACASKLFDAPTAPRLKISWPADLRSEIERRRLEYRHLAGYEL